MTETKTKTNYRAECGPLASKIPGLVLVPGTSPNGNIAGYERQADTSLHEWGTWATWRDAYQFLSGYTRCKFDTDPDFEVKS